jgi:hypothetical protein
MKTGKLCFNNVLNVISEAKKKRHKGAGSLIMRNFIICSGPQNLVGEYHQKPIVVAAKPKVWV